jgi:hypothetical protein
MNEYRQRALYTDTDSVVVEGVLDPSVVSSTEIGKFKHEDKIEKAVFLAPKTYGLQTFNS